MERRPRPADRRRRTGVGAAAHRGLRDGDTDALLRGAWLAGTCLDRAGMALQHKLAHTVGGALDLPHAPTHAVLLPT